MHGLDVGRKMLTRGSMFKGPKCELGQWRWKHQVTSEEHLYNTAKTRACRLQQRCLFIEDQFYGYADLLREKEKNKKTFVFLCDIYVLTNPSQSTQHQP